MAKKDIFIEDECLKKWMNNLQAVELTKSGERLSYRQILFKYIFGIPYANEILPIDVKELPRTIHDRYLLQKKLQKRLQKKLDAIKKGGSKHEQQFQ